VDAAAGGGRRRFQALRLFGGVEQIKGKTCPRYGGTASLDAVVRGIPGSARRRLCGGMAFPQWRRCVISASASAPRHCDVQSR